MTLDFISLFAGIGGIDLGLERAGMRCVAQVENDPWCQAVLTKHWPTVPKFGDVRDVGAHNLPRADLICGGFPCQDLSYAGRGAGLAGARSGLWFEYARIIRELRPRYVLVENVPGLLARGLGTVIGDLAACGYDAEWDCIPAAAVGAPHRRDRIWIVAYPNGAERWPNAEGRHDESDGCDGRDTRGPRDATEVSGGRQSDRGGVGTPVLAYSDGSGLEGRIFDRQYASEWLARARSRAYAEQWRVEPPVGRVAHGVPARVDRLRGLGNAVVPQVVEWIGRRIVEAEEARG